MYKKKTFFLFCAPAYIAFLIFMIVPTISGLVYAFTDWNGIKVTQFVGLSNFERVFKDQYFLDSIWFTTKMAVLGIICSNVMGFFLALLTTSKLKGTVFFRSAYFVPNLITGLVLGYFWQYIFLYLFPLLGLPNLLVDSFGGLIALTFMETWQRGGYLMLLYMAAIQNIPKELNEAAEVDGAGYLQRLRHIIWPMVAPAFTSATFITLTGAFKGFDNNFSLTMGGPFRSTEMIALNIYNTAFKENMYGYTQAKAIVYLLMIVVITSIQLYFTKRREVEM